MTALTTQVLWRVLFTLASSVWLGGYVALAVVARASTTSLAPTARVAFFRALGRAYLPVGGTALVVGILSGAVLLRDRPVDGLMIATAITAGLLVALLALGVVQARRMTRLRQRVTTAPSDGELVTQVVRGGSAATALRGLLGVLSLALVVLGSLLVR